MPDVAREVYARLADGEVISMHEADAIGPHVLPELRARATRNQRQLTEDGDSLRLVLPPRAAQLP